MKDSDKHWNQTLTQKFSSRPNVTYKKVKVTKYYSQKGCFKGKIDRVMFRWIIENRMNNTRSIRVIK